MDNKLRKTATSNYTPNGTIDDDQLQINKSTQYYPDSFDTQRDSKPFRHFGSSKQKLDSVARESISRQLLEQSFDRQTILEEFQMDQFEIIEKEVAKNQYLEERPIMLYSYMVLFLIFLNYTSNQWQRFAISFINSYDSVVHKGDPFYFIGEAVEGYENSYGTLSGPAFTIPYALALLFAGLLTDRMNRKFMLGAACVAWSLCLMLSAFATHVWLLFVSRIGLGLFQSACGSPAYSLIADYFPPEKRTFANSVYSLGIYIGQSLSSLTILLINGVGWRGSFIVIGGIGFVFGILGMVLIKEPKRGRFDVMVGEKPKLTGKNLIKDYANGFTQIFRNPCSRWIIIAGCWRFWAGNTISYYTGKYFNIYPDHINDFSYLNALALLIGGLISNMLCGYISDRYDDKNQWTKTIVCIVVTFLGIPTVFGIFLVNSNFYVSITMLFFKYMLSEGWISPSISIIQQVIDPSVKGVAISVFFLTTTLSGTLATVVVDQFIKAFDAYKHLERLGYIIVASTCIPYAIAIVCFYFAGQHYVEFKKCLHYCKTATLSNINIEDYKHMKIVDRRESMVLIKRKSLGQIFEEDVETEERLSKHAPRSAPVKDYGLFAKDKN